MSSAVLMSVARRGRASVNVLARCLSSASAGDADAAARHCEVTSATEYGAAVQRSAQVGQMLAFHNRDDTASRECIQRLLQHMSKHANLHLATVDVKNPALKGVLARAKVREVPTVLALASGAILDVRSGPQSPVELARFVERFSQAVSG